MMNQNIITAPFHNNIRPSNTGQVVVLPLNLIALIVSYLDDVGDLARVCRTCRVLHYMTLPQLHERVTLRSYAEIRYAEDEPEGCGGASPFCMALNGLVTRNVAGLVRSLTLWGDWGPHGLEDAAKVGRIPDCDMMLNITVRAAIDKMEMLESFSWQLNTRMLPTVYQGLAQRPRLESLEIRFPSSRLARQCCVIPPMPTLRSFKVSNIDPLCHPDDISLLLLQSRNLRHLKMHWSPRMRAELEPSIQLHTYFGKCVAAKYTMNLETIGFQNMYLPNIEVFDGLLNWQTVRAITQINSVGGRGDAESAFVDRNWRNMVKKRVHNMSSLKSVRTDKIWQAHVDMLSRAHGIEELFLLSSRPHGNVPAADGTPDSLDSPCSKSTPGSDHASASRDAASREPFNFKHKKPISGLARAYIDMIISKHGPSLKRLLLPDQWLLPSEELARLVRGCPNLEQLGLAMDETTLEVLGLLLPFLPKLIAIRILDPSPTQSRFRSIIEVLADPAKIQEMGCDFQRMDYHSLRWIGIGDRVMHISGPVPHSAPVAVSFDALPAEAQPQLSLPVLRWVGREAVQHVEIWSMDRLEL